MSENREWEELTVGGGMTLTTTRCAHTHTHTTFKEEGDPNRSKTSATIHSRPTPLLTVRTLRVKVTAV